MTIRRAIAFPRAVYHNDVWPGCSMSCLLIPSALMHAQHLPVSTARVGVWAEQCTCSRCGIGGSVACSMIETLKALQSLWVPCLHLHLFSPSPSLERSQHSLVGAGATYQPDSDYFPSSYHGPTVGSGSGGLAVANRLTMLYPRDGVSCTIPGTSASQKTYDAQRPWYHT